MLVLINYFQFLIVLSILRWDWDFVAYDLDGTLTGNPSGGVVVSNEAFSANNPGCTSSPMFANGMSCPKKNYIRVES